MLGREYLKVPLGGSVLRNFVLENPWTSVRSEPVNLQSRVNKLEHANEEVSLE
jgi:hypothetical protein